MSKMLGKWDAFKVNASLIFPILFNTFHALERYVREAQTENLPEINLSFYFVLISNEKQFSAQSFHLLLSFVFCPLATFQFNS